MDGKNIKTILIVDHDPITAKSETLILEKYGYKTICASDEKNAVKIIKERQDIDLILMEINFVNDLHRDKDVDFIIQEKEAPIVFLSDNDDKKYIEKTKNILSYGYVVKNTGEAALVYSIKIALKLFENINVQIIEKKANKKKSEELDNFFNLALDLLCIADTNGYFKKLNMSWKNTLGYNLSELEGKLFLDLVHPDDKAATLSAISELSKQNEVLNFTNRYKCKDGQYKWIEWRSHPEGNIIYAAARDITERIKNEQALKESEKKYLLLLNTLQEGIWVIDKDSNTTFVNPRMANMLGYTVDEMKGKHLFSFMDELGIKLCKEDLERRQKGITEQHDFEFIRKDGKRIITSLETSPIQDDKGNYIGAIAGVQDITEKKEAEKKLFESNERFKALLKELQHRVKNSLFLVSNLISIQFNASKNQDTKDALSNLLGRIRSLANLYETFSSHEKYKEVEINNYLTLIIQNIKTSYIDTLSRVSVIYNFESLIIDYKTAASIGLIMNELVTNSLKYAFNDTAKGDINIQLKKENSEIIILIEDNGVGLPEGFDIKNSKGIGMTLVNLLVKQHNGSISVEKGSGLKFIIRITDFIIFNG